MAAMTVVYLIAMAFAVVAWIAGTSLGSSGSVIGVGKNDGGVGGAEGGEAGEASGSGRHMSSAIAAALGAFGALGLLLGWASPGLNRSAELGLALFGALGLVVILWAPSRRRKG